LNLIEIGPYEVVWLQLQRFQAGSQQRRYLQLVVGGPDQSRQLPKQEVESRLALQKSLLGFSEEKRAARERVQHCIGLPSQ
jgi:hypothetical protein